MRTVLACLLLMGTLVAAATAATVVSSERIPGGVSFKVSSSSPAEASSQIFRLIPLPHSAVTAQVLPLGESTDSEQVIAGEPMVFRGLKLLPITITPDGDREVRFEVRTDPPASGKDETFPRLSRQFAEALGDLVPAEMLPEAIDEPGSYLIISDPALEADVAPLAAWKREKGFNVLSVTTQTTGLSNSQIRQYVIDRYNDLDPPLQYLLLVGDVEQIPGFDFHAVVTDQPYAAVDGEDFLPDLFVGRLPARTVVEARTMVAKTLRHERDLFLDEGTDWFARGLIVGANYGSSTPVAVSRWCRDRMKDVGFAQVDSVFYPPNWSTGLIRQFVDQGVSLVTYRGWAYGIYGWQPPTFTSSDIAALSNGWRLPVVMSYVCQNNDYSNEEECFGETWLRAGTPDSSKGAVAFIGNSEPWSHTRFNDGIAIGAFDAFGERNVRTLGSILTAGKFDLLSQFPAEIPYTGEGDESVEFYFYIYNILGDPEIALWAGPPRALQVTHPASVPAGGNFVDVGVTEADGVTPVRGARVGLSQGANLLGCAWTDASGIAHVPASLESEAQPVLVTVTGANAQPYRGNFTVVAGAPFLSVGATRIDDDSQGASLGNGDGVPNPSETLEFHVRLRNRGSAPTTAVEATLSNHAGSALSVLDGSASYPALTPGEEADPLDPFVVRIEPRAENGLRAVLRIHATAGEEISVSDLELSLVAPDLRFESAAVLGDPEENEILPGQTVDLSVVLRNEGTVATGGATVALLDRSGGLVVVEDAAAAVGPIEAGASAATIDPFRFTVDPEVAIGQGLDFSLECTTLEGAVCVSSFSLVVGTPKHDAPLGPDGYGYYAYDNSDTDYPETAPLYGWVSCSTAYGGSGTKLSLRDNRTVNVDLPFSFTYYGQAYSRIAVSDNGWLSFDTSTYFDYYNWHMPNSYGNAAQVAPFWDNLDPLKKLDGVLVADGIYVFHDAANHRFVIEWSRVGQVLVPPPDGHPEQALPYDDLQTFQAILYDPASYPTPGGNGIIEFQYKQIANNDKLRMNATVGIEDQTETVGLEYTYSNRYPPAAAPLSAGLAIRFTTQPPRYLPFRLGSFAAMRSAGGVHLSWTPIDERPRAGTRIYREVDGRRILLTPAPLAPDARSYFDGATASEAPARYWIGSIDPVGVERLLGPFLYEPGICSPAAVELAPGTANPFRGTLGIAYALPVRGPVEMHILDPAGRRVCTLVKATVDAGRWTAVWDGRDDEGHALASGVYLCVLKANGKEKSIKTILLR